MSDFKTTHDLPFEVAPWINSLGLIDAGFLKYRVGTCHGLYKSVDKEYQILAIINEKPGNGHFEDVLQWFENSCRRDKKSLVILEVWNKRFKKHLIEKRGFKKTGPDDVKRIFVTKKSI